MARGSAKHRVAGRPANRRRALMLGAAVPAVVSMGALPAFAAHSAELDVGTDEGMDDAEDGMFALDAEFADAEELDYDAFKEAANDPDGDLAGGEDLVSVEDDADDSNDGENLDGDEYGDSAEDAEEGGDVADDVARNE